MQAAPPAVKPRDCGDFLSLDGAMGEELQTPGWCRALLVLLLLLLFFLPFQSLYI